MPEKNHNCIMCDNPYYYCETCNKINSWRTICDTARHYQLYMIIKDYRDNYISIDEAKNRMNTIGITIEELNELTLENRDYLLNIFNYVKPEMVTLKIVSNKKPKK